MHNINIAIDYLHKFNLMHLLKSRAKVLSIGEQQIISFIRAIIINTHAEIVFITFGFALIHTTNL